MFNISLIKWTIHFIRYRFRLGVLLVLGLGLLVSTFSPASGSRLFVQTTAQPDYKAGEVLVKWKPGMAGMAMGVLEAEYNAVLQRELEGIGVQVWQVPAGKELEVVKSLNADPRVEYAEPNYLYRAFILPNDPGYPNQWGLTKVNAPTAWDTTTGDASIVIAVIDTGIDENHPDLKGKIWQNPNEIPGNNIDDDGNGYVDDVNGYDFCSECPGSGGTNPHDLNGHGTHVSGIAAAITNNGTGVAGISWGAKILPIRVLDASGGNGKNTDLIDGINYAWQNGAKVINLSLGGINYSQSVQDAVNAAYANGALVVAAMGNSRDEGNPTMYPAALNHVFAVSATTRNDTYAYYSQYGNHVDIAAPGGEMSFLGDSNGIFSTLPTYDHFLHTEYGYAKNYDYLQGTSQATPMVSGLAALVWSVNPSLTPDEVEAIIENTAVDLGPAGWDQNYGWGRIDAAAALAATGIHAPTLAVISNPDGDGNYTLDWDDVAYATSYKLQEDDNISFSSPSTIYTGAASQYNVSGRGAGTWYYRVKAVNGSLTSSWSNIRSTTVKPDAPALYAIDNADKDGDYLISWSNPHAADGFTLQEDDNPGFTSPVERYMGDETEYQLTGQDGGTWYYRVRAYNEGGNSPWSTTHQVDVDPPPYGAPTLQNINNPEHDGVFTVTWSSVVSATGYILERTADTYFAHPQMVYSGTMTQTQVSEHPAGKWLYRVRATGPDGKGPWSNAKQVQVDARVFMPLLFLNAVTDFDTQFNGSSSEGWVIHNGAWDVGGGTFSTEGVAFEWASASYPAEYTDFDYSVRMMRQGCADCANALFVRGTPEPLGTYMRWDAFYAFEYTASGYYAVFKRQNGVVSSIKDWTAHASIHQGASWNSLRVVLNGANMWFYINNTLVWSGTDAGISRGRVGVGIYQDGSNGNMLKVDWAKLTMLNTAMNLPAVDSGLDALPVKGERMNKYQR